MMDLVTFATRDYQWLLRPLAALYEKYAGGSVVCFGDAKMDGFPDEVEFRPIPGWDLREHFGSGFAAVMNELEDDIVLISLADMWPAGPVRLDRIGRLADELQKRKDRVVRVLVGDDLYLIRNRGQRVEDWGDLEVATVPTSDIHVGFGGGFLLWPSLWSRELALRFTEDCTLWEFEATHNRKLMAHPNLYGVWVLGSVYPYAHVYFRQHPNRVFLSQLSAEDRELVKPLLPAGMETVE